MMRKLTAALLCAPAILSLAACGETTDKDSSAADSGQEQGQQESGFSEEVEGIQKSNDNLEERVALEKADAYIV